MSAPTPIWPVKTVKEPSPASTSKPGEETKPKRLRNPRVRAFSVIEAGAAFVVFALWLGLFAAGILVDTRPHRSVISPSGVAAMDAEAIPAAARSEAASSSTSAAATAAATQVPGPVGWKVLAKAWLVVLLAYLPLNLAWLCAVASTLGTFGSRVNLSDDRERDGTTDNTSPYVSALLRGFFVYLFMTSGLLLLDETPFSSPSPGQYIRLAGFLSLFSFVISYQPRLFTALVVSAFQRIQVRDRAHDNEPERSDTSIVVRKEATKKEEVVVHQTSEASDPDK